MTIEESFLKLESYIKSQNFRGYDPYDILLSRIPIRYLGNWTAVIATQIQKRNPLNLRPILGIKKEINPKAMGILLQAYSIRLKDSPSIEYKRKADYLFKWLKNNYSKGFSGYCWGYNFPWAGPKKYLAPYTPSSVVTAIVCKGIWEYYIATGDIDAANIITSSSNFIRNDLITYSDSSGICMSYTPNQPDICYNASLLAGEVLAMNYAMTSNLEMKDMCSDLVEFVISRQKKDGFWFYSQDIFSGQEKKQIDFHQGYILESLDQIMNLCRIDDPSWIQSIKNGLAYYSTQQFTRDGKSYWRIPKKNPIDIHNQAQGIITLCKLRDYDLDLSNLTFEIANWTINNMQSQKGHFYYQNHKYYTNKISYYRWSQAWMMLALTYFLQTYG